MGGQISPCSLPCTWEHSIPSFTVQRPIEIVSDHSIYFSVISYHMCGMMLQLLVTHLPVPRHMQCLFMCYCNWFYFVASTELLLVTLATSTKRCMQLLLRCWG